MLQVGKVKEIWRYPVKGMAGERLAAGTVGDKGLKGDRIWALRDELRKEIQSCKFRPELLLCTASARNDPADKPGTQVDVTLPDGSVLGSDHPEIHARLSTLTGHASTLEPLRPETDTDFYRRRRLDDHTWLKELVATFDREAGEPLPDFSQLPPEMVEFVSKPGTFFLVTTLHLVTTATLAHLKGRNARADWDARRFRPNFVIETHPGSEGLVEQGWIGKRLAIGDAAVDCVAATPRCGAVTRAQPDFEADKTILRTVVKDADQNVGIYGVVTKPGGIRDGDPVFLG